MRVAAEHNSKGFLFSLVYLRLAFSNMLLRNGASPRKNTSVNTKKLTVEVYENMNIEFQAHHFSNGALGMMLSNDSISSRLNSETDNGMRMYSGLIAKDPSKHPSWERDLLGPLEGSSTASIAYLSPTNNENFTRLSIEVMKNESADVIHCPGAWVLQMAANDIYHFYELLDRVFQTTVLNDGWTFNSAFPKQKKSNNMSYFIMHPVCTSISR